MRNKIVQTALSWIGTPYHNHARIKGVGVDCAQLVAGVAFECGIIDKYTLERIPTNYNPQHHIHSSEEKLLKLLKDFGCLEIDKELTKPGDIVTFKYGRATSHLGIVVSDHTFVHAEGRGSRSVIEMFWNEDFLKRWTYTFKFPGVE